MYVSKLVLLKGNIALIIVSLTYLIFLMVASSSLRPSDERVIVSTFKWKYRWWSNAKHIPLIPWLRLFTLLQSRR